MERITYLILLFMLCFAPARSQFRDLNYQKGFKKVDIPFEIENDFIVIKVIFNGTFPLKFIFDTGAEHTILTKREISDLLQLKYRRRFIILGSDMKTELTAYLVQGVKLRISTIEAINRSILVLEDDYFRFEEFAGIDVQGILGADFFRRFVVKINYRRKIITLYDPGSFRPPRGKFASLPIEIKRHKPYIQAGIYFRRDSAINVKLLVDTGASLSLLLHTQTHPGLDLPPQVIRSNIGMGLGGYLEGFLGRLEQLELAGFHMENVLTNFQEVLPDIDTAYLNQRNGIIGNQVLSRFIVIIDYIRGIIYLQPSREFRRKFQYDRSGLLIASSGPRLNQYTVFDVVSGSPADEAGIQVGDEIRTVNRLPVNLLSLMDISRKLKRKPGKKISMIIKREGKKFRKSFVLRDII